MIKIWMIGGNSIHFIYNPCTVNDLTHARSTSRDGTHTLITKPKTVLIHSLVSTLSTIAPAILKTHLFNAKGTFQIGTKWPKLSYLYHLVIYFFYFELVLPNEYLHQGDLAYLLAYITVLLSENEKCKNDVVLHFMLVGGSNPLYSNKANLCFLCA